MDLRTGIVDAAGALGIDPFDLATAISYETGGTFDPLKQGPTTQWGQHRGLIQFGEPQARQHGVDWQNPMASQLGAEGAVVSYLRNAGVQPGMGLLDVYSAINAGAPGLYNRSDEDNGGAPGTVRDKVEKQMDGHRRKAAALLGQEWTPPARQAMRQPTAQTAQPRISTQGTTPKSERKGLFNPDVRDRLIVALEGMTLNPNQALQGMAAQGISDRRTDKKTAEARNRTAEWLASQGRDDLAQAVMSGALDGRSAASVLFAQPEDSRTALQKNVEFLVNDLNVPVGEALQRLQAGTVVNVGDTAPEPPKGMIFATDDAGNTLYENYDLGDGRTGQRPVTIPLRGTEAEKKVTDAEKQEVNAINQAQIMLDTIDSVLGDPALNQAVGMDSFLSAIPGTGARRAESKIGQLQGQVFLQAYEALKGGGVITEIEGQKAEQAIARLDRGQSDSDFREALRELRDIVETAHTRAKILAGARASELSDKQLMDIYGG